MLIIRDIIATTGDKVIAEIQVVTAAELVISVGGYTFASGTLAWDFPKTAARIGCRQALSTACQAAHGIIRMARGRIADEFIQNFKSRKIRHSA